MKENARKLRYFADVFESLKQRGLCKTTDPRHICREDVESFIFWMRERNLCASTRTKYLNILDAYLTVWGNGIIGELKNNRLMKLRSSEVQAPIRALTVEEIQALLDSTYKIGGWPGQVIRGLIALGFGTGCRPKELFMAETDDLDLANGRFFVRHPKGEGTWGIPQWVLIIRGDMIPYLEEFINARKSLKGPGAMSKYLFCNPKASKALDGNTIRMYKAKTEELTGISWRIKDLRSTLATVSIAGDVSRLKAVSLQLRHSSVKNTEKFYARINSAEEVKKTLGDVWVNNPVKKQRFLLKRISKPLIIVFIPMIYFKIR